MSSLEYGAELWKAALGVLPQLFWAFVTLSIFLALRPQIAGLLASAERVVLKIGKAEFSLTVKEASVIVQELLNYLQTLSTDQVRLLFRLIRLKDSNTLFKIPAPDQDRENAFHENLRLLREGHLVHAVDSDGSPAGRFKAGRLVDLFPWALRLPDMAADARTPDGKAWKEIHSEVASEEIQNIIKALDSGATAPKSA